MEYSGFHNSREGQNRFEIHHRSVVRGAPVSERVGEHGGADDYRIVSPNLEESPRTGKHVFVSRPMGSGRLATLPSEVRPQRGLAFARPLIEMCRLECAR
jgi:hypothetical protein